MSFPARYTGVCVECGRGFEVGTPIESADDDYNGRVYRHVTCPEDPDRTADRQAMSNPRCPRCGTNHPGEC